MKFNRSECDHLLQFPAKRGKERSSIVADRLPWKTKSATCFALRGERFASSSRVITVHGVVFVRVQRRDAYYRNDPSKYGLNVSKVTGRTHLTKIFDTCGTQWSSRDGVASGIA